jgi:hypothetical protein
MKVRFGQPIHQNSSDNLRPQHQHQVPLPKVPTETVPPIPEIKFPEKSDSKDTGECNKKLNILMTGCLAQFYLQFYSPGVFGP